MVLGRRSSRAISGGVLRCHRYLRRFLFAQPSRNGRGVPTGPSAGADGLLGGDRCGCREHGRDDEELGADHCVAGRRLVVVVVGLVGLGWLRLVVVAGWLSALAGRRMARTVRYSTAGQMLLVLATWLLRESNLCTCTEKQRSAESLAVSTMQTRPAR